MDVVVPSPKFKVNIIAMRVYSKAPTALPASKTGSISSMDVIDRKMMFALHKMIYGSLIVSRVAFCKREYVVIVIAE